MSDPVWLDRTWQGFQRMVMEPYWCSRFQEDVLAWCRLHGLNPSRTKDIVLAPSLGFLAAYTYNVNDAGDFFLTDDGQGSSFQWLFKRLLIPPPAEWCLDYVTRQPILDAEELTR